MSVGIVAARYAKSLIELAKEKNVLEQVFEDMKLFKNIADNNRDLMLALKSPVVRHHQKLAILKSLFKERVNPVSYSIFEIITKKNRESILDAIADEFIISYNLYQGIQDASVTTSVALSDELRKQFINIVSDATGKKVNLEEKVDSSLIGGYILRINDRQFDTSIKSRLNKLKLELAS